MQLKLKQVLCAVFLCALLVVSGWAFAQGLPPSPQNVVIPTLHRGQPADLEDQTKYDAGNPCVGLFNESPGPVVQVLTRPDPVGPFKVRASGFFVSSDGKILTVLSRLSRHGGGIRVVTAWGSMATVDLIAEDKRWDIAVLKLRFVMCPRFPEPKLQTASLQRILDRSAEMRMMPPVYFAVSYPQREHRAFLSEGRYSRIVHLPFVVDPYGKIPDDLDPTRDMLMFDMHGQLFSAGAPVFNEKGEVVGMVESCVDSHSILYATPAAELERVLSRTP